MFSWSQEKLLGHLGDQEDEGKKNDWRSTIKEGIRMKGYRRKPSLIPRYRRKGSKG